MEDVKEDRSAERNEQPMSLKSKIVLSLYNPDGSLRLYEEAEASTSEDI